MTQSLKQRLAALGIHDPKALVESMAAKGQLKRSAIAVDYEAIERKAQEAEAKRIKTYNTKRIRTRKGWVKPISPAEARSSVNVEAGATTVGATRPTVES